MNAVDTSPEAVCPYENCEQVVYDEWLQKLGLHRAFVCYEIKEEMEYLSSMVFTHTNLHLLRMMPRKKGYAYVVYTKPLTEITMITSRAHYPEVITITYGNPESEEPGVSDRSDRFFIPDADVALYILVNIIERAKGTTGKSKRRALRASKHAGGKSSKHPASKSPKLEVDEDAGEGTSADNLPSKPSTTESSSAEGASSKPEDAKDAGETASMSGEKSGSQIAETASESPAEDITDMIVEDSTMPEDGTMDVPAGSTKDLQASIAKDVPAEDMKDTADLPLGDKKDQQILADDSKDVSEGAKSVPAGGTEDLSATDIKITPTEDKASSSKVLSEVKPDEPIKDVKSDNLVAEKSANQAQNSTVET